MKKQLPYFFIIFLIIFLPPIPLIAATPSETQQTPILKPFVATYMVTAMGLEGINVTNSLSMNKNTKNQLAYHFKSYSMTVGFLAFRKDETRDELSEGFIYNRQIRPELYRYKQIRKKKTKKQVEITFDWTKNQVINKRIDKNSHWSMPINANTIDKLFHHLPCRWGKALFRCRTTHSDPVAPSDGSN